MGKNNEIQVMDLPSGGKPPATDEEDGLLLFLDSTFETGSVSGLVNLLPVALAWDKFCKKMHQICLKSYQFNLK